MKPVEKVTACVCDYGYYIPLAEKLAETYKKVYYHTPIDREFVDLKDCVFGDGLPSVERCDMPLRPEFFDKIDLWVFPDIGYQSLQQHLRAQGKAVWGSFDATELEMYRTRFLKTLNDLGLPTVKSVTKRGLTALSDYLKTVENKWIKVNRYRALMETWHHIDFEHSQRELEALAYHLGGAKEHVVFVVQDNIDTKIEIGYDGWTVLGDYPNASFQGYEKKNELYLGSLRTYKQLPDEVKLINKTIAPLLRKFGYANFIASEIRVADESYFIDPTFRMPGQTGEQLLETCANLAEVIWIGAHGQVKQPDFVNKYAVSATLHYEPGEAEEWKTVQIPKSVRRWAKLSHYSMIDGAYHFPPASNKELGVMLGVGDSIPQAFAHLKKNLVAIEREPINYHLDGFFDLLDAIREAEKHGMKFSDEPIPTKEAVLKFTV